MPVRLGRANAAGDMAEELPGPELVCPIGVAGPQAEVAEYLRAQPVRELRK